jgi:uncharacterized membrane protein
MVVAYPFIGYALQRNGFAGFLPIILALILCWRALSRSTSVQRFYLFALAGLLLSGVMFFSDVTSQIIPVIIYCLLIWFFGRTLLNPPSLLERFAGLFFADIPDDVLRYCRKLTWIWMLLFIVIVIASLLLIITNQAWYFAVLHGVVTWLLIAVLTVVEHIYRLKRFPFMHGQMPSIKATVQSAIRDKDKLW